MTEELDSLIGAMEDDLGVEAKPVSLDSMIDTMQEDMYQELRSMAAEESTAKKQSDPWGLKVNTEQWLKTGTQSKPPAAESAPLGAQPDTKLEVAEQKPLVAPVDEYGIQKPESLVRREEAAIKMERADKLADAIGKSGGRSWGQYIEERLPFIGVFASINNAGDVADAAKRIESGQPTDKDYEIVGSYIKQHEINQGKGWLENIGDIVSHAPAFAAEFAATGGAYRMGAAGGRAIVGAGAKGALGLGQRLVAGGLGAAAQTAANPGRIIEAIQQRGLNDTIVQSEDGRYWFRPPTENSIARGAAQAFFEFATERVGGSLVADKIAGVFTRHMAADTAVTPGIVTAISRELGFDGVTREVGEEVVNSIANSLIGNQPMDQAIPDAQRLIEMYAAFSVPGGIKAGAARMFREKNPTATAADIPLNPSRAWVRENAGITEPTSAEQRAEIADQMRQDLATPSQAFEVSPEAAAQMADADRQIKSGEIDLGEQAPAEVVQSAQMEQMNESPAAPPVVEAKSWEVLDANSIDYSEDADDYYYHVTTPERAEVIMREGFKNRGVKQSMAAGDYRAYSKGKTFFSERNAVGFWRDRIEEHLQTQTDDEVGPLVVVRIPKADVPFAKVDFRGAEDSGRPSFYVDKPIARAAAPSAVTATTPTEAANEAESQAEAQGQGQEVQEDVLEQPEQGAVETPPPPSLTATQNATVAQIRQAYNLGDRKPPSHFGFEEGLEQAVTMPEGELDLWYEELKADPRPIGAVEEARMAVKGVRLQNLYDQTLAAESQARAAGNMAEVATLEKRNDVLFNEIGAWAATTEATGTEWGRAGVFRRMMIDRSFNLQRMVTLAQNSYGRDLNAQERQQIEALSARVKELEAIIAGNGQKAAETAVQAIAEAPTKKGTKRAASAKKQVKDALVEWNKALAALTAAQSSLGAGANEFLAASVKLAAAYAKLGIATAADFISAVAAETGQTFNEDVQAALSKAWDDSKQLIAADRKAKVAELRTKIDPADYETIHKFANTIAKMYAEDGIRDRDQLIDAVQAELAQVIPDITRRDTIDAIPGYGIYRAPSEDEAKKFLAQAKQEMLLLSKIDDLKKKIMPLLTGAGRHNPTDEQRRLLKEYYELKKQQMDLIPELGSKHARSALDSMKTRLRNQIADLDWEIQNKQRIIRKKGQVTTDAEFDDLKKQRDALKEIHETIFEKPGLTEEQQIQRAIAAQEKIAETYKARIAKRDYGKRLNAKQPLHDPSGVLDAKTAEAEYWRSLFEELKSLATKPSKEEREDAAYRRMLAEKMADYQRRMELGNFDKKPLEEKKRSPEAEKAKVELEQVRRKFYHEMEMARRAQRSTGKVLTDSAYELITLIRAINSSTDFSAVMNQGGLVSIAHPVAASAALQKMLVAATSETKARHLLVNVLEADSDFQESLRAGVSYSDIDGLKLAHQEEIFATKALEWLPKPMQAVVKGSERAYVTYLNFMRLATYKALKNSVAKGGEASKADGQVIANYVNVATGRGDMGSLAGATKLLTTIFYAPRYALSRFQYALGQPLWYSPKEGKASWAVRRAIANEYARSLGGIATIYGTALLAGTAMGGDDNPVKIGLDPRSTDFLKLRIGDTAIDILGGVSQATVFMARLASGKSTSQTGKVEDTDVNKLVGSFGRGKLAPAFSLGLDLMTGKGFSGRDLEKDSEAVRLGEAALGRPMSDTEKWWAARVGRVGESLTPITFGDIYQSMKEQGLAGGSALGFMAAFGVRVQTYALEAERVIRDMRSLDPDKFNFAMERIVNNMTPDEAHQFKVEAFGRIMEDLSDPRPYRETQKRNDLALPEWERKVERARRLLLNTSVDPYDLEGFFNEYERQRGVKRGTIRERQRRARRELVET